MTQIVIISKKKKQNPHVLFGTQDEDALLGRIGELIKKKLTDFKKEMSNSKETSLSSSTQNIRTKIKRKK